LSPGVFWRNSETDGPLDDGVNIASLTVNTKSSHQGSAGGFSTRQCPDTITGCVQTNISTEIWQDKFGAKPMVDQQIEFVGQPNSMDQIHGESETARGVDATCNTMSWKQGRVETMPMSSQGRSLS
jgi:hypothetical protein